MKGSSQHLDIAAPMDHSPVAVTGPVASLHSPVMVSILARTAANSGRSRPCPGTSTLSSRNCAPTHATTSAELIRPVQPTSISRKRRSTTCRRQELSRRSHPAQLGRGRCTGQRRQQQRQVGGRVGGRCVCAWMREGGREGGSV